MTRNTPQPAGHGTAPGAGSRGCGRRRSRRQLPVVARQRLDERDDLVLVDTAALDARVHGWFLDLTRRFLDYRTVVLFTGRTS